MKREKLNLSLIVLSLVSTAPAFAAREAFDDYQDSHDSILSGIAIVPPVTIERFIRQAIAAKLDGDARGAKIEFQAKAVHQEIRIPEENVALREVLLALGIKKTFQAQLSPIDVGFSLPTSGLDLKLRQSKTGIFDVVAKWKITTLSAKSRLLSIHVPKGLFDRDFNIDSKPVKITFAPKSKPILVELKLQVRLADTGTKVKLVALKTNINDANPAVHPAFDFQIGQLTIGGQPLVLEIESNGRILRAEEKEIREQLETLEPQFTATLRRDMEEQLTKYFEDLADTFAKSPPFKIKVSTNKLLQNLDEHSAVNDLLKGIEADFIFSSLDYLAQLNLFTAKIASHICFDQQCLFNLDTSPISQEDLKPLSQTKEVGMLIYESWLQRVVNSDPFQTRIRKYYDTQVHTPGVDIGKAGVKLHLNPTTKSIDAVFNLSIDIKKTALSKDANTRWKKFIARSKKNLGDLMETFFGTGKRVIIPVEVHLVFQGYQKGKDEKGEPVTNLVFKSELPFHPDGTVTNTYHYPSNISELTKVVRSEFMTEIAESIKDLVPPKIEIPVPAVIPAMGVKLPLKKVLVSPNNGLIFTAEVPEVPVK
jgi:hypothetical protein